MQTYFVVLDDDAHDSSAPNGALTFFKKVAADLPQAVSIIDATQTSSAMAAQQAAANFSQLVTRLGTCLYDYGVPAGTDPTRIEVKYSVPGRPDTVVPLSTSCNETNQDAVNGWNFDGGRLRICGSSCKDLRDTILASAAAALQATPPQTAPDIPVTATILCSGTAPISDAGPVFPVSDAGDGGSSLGPDGGIASGDDAGTSADGSAPVSGDAGAGFLDAGVVTATLDGGI